MSGTEKELWTDPRCTLLTNQKFGPFVKLGAGDILTVEGAATLVSADNGTTWSEPRPIDDAPGPGTPSSSGVMLRTHEGVIVFVYMDMANFKWSWDEDRREAAEDVSLNVWAIQSPDEGITWTGRQQIFDGYCGALIHMIQTSSGEIVVPIQRLVRDPCRHAICVYVSADSGTTWQHSNIIDLGGHGHHDGAMEPTLVELSDGRLWMLIRTNLGRFWSAYSTDKGLSWRVIRPSDIDASSAPAAMIRLASGRLALVWNRFYPEGATDYPLRGGDGNLSAVPTSWHREELSLAFSDDDGCTWSKPVVILRMKGGGPSYPHLFEPEPGELWITTQFRDKVAMCVRESDFV
ncbi:MAG: sialidase family protein [Candidatus Poribacteria bacterium]|nr:sialidase family protein [Candidatus Poribacteria bacterium]